MYFGEKERTLVGEFHAAVNDTDFTENKIAWTVRYKSDRGEDALILHGYKGNKGLTIGVWTKYYQFSKEGAIEVCKVIGRLLGIWGMSNDVLSQHIPSIVNTLTSSAHGGSIDVILEGVSKKKLTEIKYKLKMDNPSPEPTPEMGSPMSGGDEGFGEEMPADDFGGGEEMGSDKPFDDTPFDAGVEASEDDSPEKYIQQLSGKLGQSLRKYTQDSGQPDFDLEKFAINSVLSATNSSKMDQQDQSDIISKVKSSSTDSNQPDEDKGKGDGNDLPSDEMGSDEMGGEGELDLSDIEMEEGHNPNFNRKTVFQDDTLGVKDGGMEENKYLNLENDKKKGKFVIKTKIRDMINKTINESPTIEPQVKPIVTPERRETRRSKPWRVIPEGVPQTEPKALDKLTYIDSEFKGDNEVILTFDVGDVRFSNITFTNTNEVLEKPREYDEPWVYSFESEVLSNRKKYGVGVSFYGNPHTNLELEGFADGEVPEIQEI